MAAELVMAAEVARTRAIAVHKPRGYISERVTRKLASAGTLSGDTATQVDGLGRPSVYRLVDGLQQASALSAVGRLDVETSGLMLFTTDSDLNSIVRNGHRVEKVYVASVSGRGVSEDKLSKAITSLQCPLDLPKSTECQSEDSCLRSASAKARFLRRWSLSPAVGDDVKSSTNVASGTASVSPMDSASAAPPTWCEHVAAEMQWRAHRRCALNINSVQEVQNGEGDMIDIEIRLREGKFHQVRRLIKRAGLKMRHLRRVAIGPVTLAGVEVPGQTRELTQQEIKGLIA